MKIYRGLFDTQGYGVQVDDRPLPLHRHYVDHRKWHAEAGRKQLALDLLIDVLGETIPNGFLGRRDRSGADAGYQHGCAAWLPHLHYAAHLEPLARNTGYGHWELSGEQIAAWLDDWLLEHHQTRAHARSRGHYRGMPFDEWVTEFQTAMQHFSVTDLTRIKLGRPAQIQYYLAGYTPEGMVIAWCQRVLILAKKTDPITSQSETSF